ncbi:twin-arginine translocase subunit TatC [Halosimplex salinum]|uniref:twin-arginine translocase subunit TatC n=1 Tax=Halosimplex salinum TaxID=1710538 RepID=UPI000F493B93|nr:twin-arginine translocase subunit TatC [Halosimplex salinum]
MTGPSANPRTTGDGPAPRAALADARDDIWTVLAGVLAFLFGTLATFLVVRSAVWDVLKADLNTNSAIEIIAVTPFDVIFLQAQIAATVGVLLALETVCYLTRSALLGGEWWPRGPLPAGARAVLVVVGLALFPIGAALGYDHVFPVVLDILASPGSRWTIVRWGRVSLLTAVVSGIAVQLAFVGTVLSLSNWRQ